MTLSFTVREIGDQFDIVRLSVARTRILRNLWDPILGSELMQEIQHPLLPAQLQRLDRIYWKYQHHDLQQQTVSNPKDQDQFQRNKYDQRTAEAEASRDYEANQAAERVAEGVDNRVAGITDRSGFRAIAIDDEVRVFENFPRRLRCNRERELPTWAQPARQPKYQPKKREAVKHMSETVRIEEVL